MREGGRVCGQESENVIRNVRAAKDYFHHYCFMSFPGAVTFGFSSSGFIFALEPPLVMETNEKIQIKRKYNNDVWQGLMWMRQEVCELKGRKCENEKNREQQVRESLLQ